MEQNNDGCMGCGQEQTVNVTPNAILQQNAPCTGCGSKSMTGKLGTCQQCIALNIIGSLFGWLVFVTLYFLYPERGILMAMLVVASFFTLLLTAHGIAYVLKKNAKK